MTISSDPQTTNEPETLISFIYTDDTIQTDCDNDCRQRATYELTLRIPDDSTDDTNTTIEYTCDDHLRHYTALPTTLSASEQLELRCTDLTARIRRHVATNDHDSLTLLHMATLLNDYSRALNDVLLYACYELADDLLACSTDDHLTNGI